MPLSLVRAPLGQLVLADVDSLNLPGVSSCTPLSSAPWLLQAFSSAPSPSAASTSDSSGVSVLAYFTRHVSIHTQLFLCGIFCRKRKLFSHILLQLQKPASTSGNVGSRTKPSTSKWTRGMRTVVIRPRVLKAIFRGMMGRKL